MQQEKENQQVKTKAMQFSKNITLLEGFCRIHMYGGISDIHLLTLGQVGGEYAFESPVGSAWATPTFSNCRIGIDKLLFVASPGTVTF